MKKITITLLIVLSLLFGATVLSHAWGLPVNGYERAFYKAIEYQAKQKDEKAHEQWKIVIEKGEEILKALPKDANYYMGVAEAYYALGNNEKTIELYNKALQLKTEEGVKNLAKEYPWTYVYLGHAYAEVRNYEMAEKTWEQISITAGPVYSSVQYFRNRYKEEALNNQ